MRVDFIDAQHPRLPDTISFLEGALLEPLSVAMHATNRAQLRSLSTSSVLVLGAGTIGLLCAAMCKARGIVNIKIADIQGHRVHFATDHQFATKGLTIPLRKSTTSDENLAAAKAIAARACDHQLDDIVGFDVVFECTGVEACTQIAIYVSKTATSFDLDSDYQRHLA